MTTAQITIDPIGFNLDCTTHITALFNITPTPPTCLADGSLPTFPIVRTGYTLTVNHPITDGPGVYIITATAATGYAFSGPGDPFVRTTTVTCTVSPSSGG